MYVVDQPIHSGKKYAVSYIINYLNISVAIANFIRDLQKNTVLPKMQLLVYYSARLYFSYAALIFITGCISTIYNNRCLCVCVKSMWSNRRK
jgi:hypothetical protein